MKIFVIGFIGSKREEKAKELAKKYNLIYHHMDKDIEEFDGRSILRMVMSMGEHEYRNKEYEQLQRYMGVDNIVVSCGDGIVVDDQNRQLLEKERIVVVEDTIENLWKEARNQKDLPYAFLYGSNEEDSFAQFQKLYEKRKPLYQQLKEENHEKKQYHQ